MPNTVTHITTHASGLLVSLVGAAGAVAQTVVPSSISGEAHAWAALFGAAGGLVAQWATPRIKPFELTVISDWYDGAVSLAIAAICGSLLGPVAATYAMHGWQWDWLDVLPMDGLIPASAALGALMPLLLQLFFSGMLFLKKHPTATIDWLLSA